MTISLFWKKRDLYSLEQAAYLSCGIEPKEPTEEMPYKVKIAYEDIKTNTKKHFPHVKTEIESGKTVGINKEALISFVNSYQETDFFQDSKNTTFGSLGESNFIETTKIIDNNVKRYLCSKNNVDTDTTEIHPKDNTSFILKERKLAFLKRDYYPLKLAAEILNCTEGDLIHLGTKDELPIFILTANFIIKSIHAPRSGEPNYEFGSERKKLMKLAPLCLIELEAGNSEVTPCFERIPRYEYDSSILGPMPHYLTNEDIGRWRNGYIHYELQHRKYIYPTINLLLEYQKRGYKTESITPPPVLLQDCTMVIMSNDLKQLSELNTINDPQIKATNDKKLIDWSRNRDELTLAIREFLEQYNTFPGDPMPMPPLQAWAKILGNYFNNNENYISEIKPDEGLIELNRAKNKFVDKTFFCKRYNSRFK